jgi:arsenate reductase (thioredoxin)
MLSMDCHQEHSMKFLILAVAAVVVMASLALPAESPKEKATMYSEVQAYVEQRVKEFDQIPDERRSQLKQLAHYVKSRVQSGEPARLTFICTHNSRRSHMSQIWASTAAAWYHIDGVETYSGGTEASAFNPRAIAALERSGLKARKLDDNKNPRYEIRFENTDHPRVCFSKAYSESPNPKADFCAIMTCSQADKSCPTVEGASLRVALPFEDPKVADGTPEEAATYDERCQQISREMLYVFSQVAP